MLKTTWLLTASAAALIATPAEARHHHRHYYRHYYSYYSPYRYYPAYSYAYPVYSYSYPVYYSYPAYYSYPTYPTFGISIGFGGGYRRYGYRRW